jgi:outer membrane protein OmpA-like peptidoglycan-associated protein
MKKRNLKLAAPAALICCAALFLMPLPPFAAGGDAAPKIGNLKVYVSSAYGVDHIDEALTAKEARRLDTARMAIIFETNSAHLEPESYAALDEIAELFKKRPDASYEIQGHTDGDGADSLNMALSASRAASVMNYLISKGISRRNLVAIGYGPHKPVAGNEAPEEKAQNRRVEFKQITSREEYNRLRELEAKQIKEMHGAGN